MKRLEHDVLAALDKIILKKGVKPEDSLPLWACVMQLIFMYRDLHKSLTDSCRALKQSECPRSINLFVEASLTDHRRQYV